MCGIGGVIELDGSRLSLVERRGEMERMLGLLQHRGPDETGYVIDPRVALCATRLKINDLSHGQQPMSDESGRWWSVYNGEIYNHRDLRRELERIGYRFRTDCDTEVALHAWKAWGRQAPPRFDGGFAMAVYDRRDRTVTLIRDRFGKRPLYISHSGPRVMFGSEMKAFLACRNHAFQWNPQHLTALFTHWTSVGTETPFVGIEQVPAGTMLEISPHGVTRERFADLPRAAITGTETFEDATEHTRELLRQSVDLRLRSDVESGLQLSGGLDSTILAHLVQSQQAGRMRSFSITFDEAEYDETAAQNRVAQTFGLTHHRLRVTAGDIAETFPAALWHAEVPQFRTAFVPMFLLSRFVRDHGIKVMLSGEGADEVFFGYDIFKETQLREAWPTLTTVDRRAAIQRLYPYLPLFSEANVRALEVVFSRSVAARPDRTFSHTLRFENGRFATRLLQAVPHTEHPALNDLMATFPGYDDLPRLRQSQFVEFQTLLQGYLLSSQGDRMAFAHGVEPRCPFLSLAVVDHAATLPIEYHLSGDGIEKRLLKQAFGSALPPEILARPKQPYRTPGTACFFDSRATGRGRFVEWVEERLAPRTLETIAPLQVSHAQQFIDKIRMTAPSQISAREDQAFLLLLSLSELNRQFVQKKQIEPVGLLPLCVATVFSDDDSTGIELNTDRLQGTP